MTNRMTLRRGIIRHVTIGELATYARAKGIDIQGTTWCYHGYPSAGFDTVLQHSTIKRTNPALVRTPSDRGYYPVARGKKGK